jgi:WD40 repeat protein
LAFSPDGSTLAIAHNDITLWDLKTGTVQTVIKNQLNDPVSIITEIQFSSDGSRIFGIQKRASGYPCYIGWGSLVIYNVETGELVFRHDYERYEEGPDTLFAEKDSIAYISYQEIHEGSFFLEVDLVTGKVLRKISSPAIHSMNDTAAVTYEMMKTEGNEEGYTQAHIVDLNSFGDMETFDGYVEMIPHSNRILVREEQRLSVRTLENEILCSEHVSPETDNAFPPKMFSMDGSVAVSWNSYGDRAGDVRVWNLAQCTISEPVLIFPEVARQMSISADGSSVLTGSRAGYTFFVFDVKTGQMRFSLSGIDAQFSADGQQVFVVEEDAINAYDVVTGEHLYLVLKTDSTYSTTILVSPNGKSLALSGNLYGDYQIINIDENSSIGKMPILVNGRPHFSLDGMYMVTVDEKRATYELHFWQLSSGSELKEWQGLIPKESFTSIAFNSDFSQLATRGTDGYYVFPYIWDIPSLSLVNVLTQPPSDGNRYFTHLNYISDDLLLFALGSNPDALLFWDIQTGNLLSEIPVDILVSEFGTPITFSPDGRLILMADNDGTIQVWGIK